MPRFGGGQANNRLCLFTVRRVNRPPVDAIVSRLHFTAMSRIAANDCYDLQTRRSAKSAPNQSMTGDRLRV